MNEINLEKPSKVVAVTENTKNLRKNSVPSCEKLSGRKHNKASDPEISPITNPRH